jgi:hypothetical protein
VSARGVTVEGPRPPTSRAVDADSPDIRRLGALQREEHYCTKDMWALETSAAGIPLSGWFAAMPVPLCPREIRESILARASAICPRSRRRPCVQHDRTDPEMRCGDLSGVAGAGRRDSTAVTRESVRGGRIPGDRREHVWQRRRRSWLAQAGGSVEHRCASYLHELDRSTSAKGGGQGAARCDAAGSSGRRKIHKQVQWKSAGCAARC